MAAKVAGGAGSRTAEERAAARKRWATWKRRAASWVHDRLAVLPYHWRRRAEAEYARLLAGGSEYAGNAWLRDLTDRAAGRVSLAASDGDIAEQARVAALAGYDLCRLAGLGRSIEQIRVQLEGHCSAWGVAAPSGGGAPAIARMLCHRWWVRRLRAAVARRCEAAAVGARLVCRGVWPYASQDGVERRRAQRARNAQALARAVLRDMETGEEVALDAVVSGSVANPQKRRNELMVRIRGCEEWATARSQGAEFWTVTTPSRFHASRMVGDVAESNPAYAGQTPDEAQRYLCAVWARARAAWQRRGLVVYGMRVAEPHHDATPHWHILAFGPARDLRFARRLLAIYAKRDAAGEAGAKQYRFKAERISAAKGDAAGYVAKYVAKNIDGFGVGVDGETGRAAGKMVKRCDAWAAAWRIRQFQFFGVPSVTVWRALRKVREAVPVAAVEAARAAADAGDWRAYCDACGGCAVPRSAIRVWLDWAPSGRQTSYGDEAAPVPAAFGSVAGSVPIARRVYQIRWGKNGVGLAPRTRGNNCTRPAGEGAQAVIDLWASGVKSGGAGYQQSLFNRRE